MQNTWSSLLVFYTELLLIQRVYQSQGDQDTKSKARDRYKEMTKIRINYKILNI